MIVFRILLFIGMSGAVASLIGMARCSYTNNRKMLAAWQEVGMRAFLVLMVAFMGYVFIGSP
jgi:hypothetical protein